MGLNADVIQQMRAATGSLVLMSGETAWYVGIGHLIPVLRWLDSRGYRALGFEGFVCDGSSIHPVEGYVADLSDEQGDELIEVAQLILAGWVGRVEWIDISPITGR